MSAWTLNLRWRGLDGVKSAAIALATLLATPSFAQPPEPTMTDKGQIIGPFKFPQNGGPALYAAACESCHMPGARGAAGAGRYPPLAGDPKVGSAYLVIRWVLDGHRGMPAFGSQLDDKQIADLATYVRTNFGNSYPAQVTPEQVKAIRSRP